MHSNLDRVQYGYLVHSASLRLSSTCYAEGTPPNHRTSKKVPTVYWIWRRWFILSSSFSISRYAKGPINSYELRRVSRPFTFVGSQYTAKTLVRLGLKTAAGLRLFKDFFKPKVLILRPWWRSECSKREKLALVLKVKTFLWYSVRPGWWSLRWSYQMIASFQYRSI